MYADHCYMCLYAAFSKISAQDLGFSDLNVAIICYLLYLLYMGGKGKVV